MKKINERDIFNYAKSIEYEKYKKWADENHVDTLEVVIDKNRHVPGEISCEIIDEMNGEIYVTVRIFKPRLFGILSSTAKHFSVFPNRGAKS